jgi:coiled-coil domain-containing protein 61
MPNEIEQTWPDTFTEERDFCFHEVDYSIRVQVTDERFFVEAQDVETGELWRNCFERVYIEDITRKASSFKKFKVFTKMLLDAMACDGDPNCAVSINLHTYEHLEKLIHNKTQKVSNRAKNKRYLILTYEADYDRVQYPLCLKYTTPSSAEMLKELAKLRRQIHCYRKKEKENEVELIHKSKKSLKEENRRLKLLLEREAAPDAGHLQDNLEAIEYEVEELRILLEQKDEELLNYKQGTVGSADLVEQLEKTLMRVEKENEDLNRVHKKEMKRITDELTSRDTEIDKLRGQLERLRSRHSKLQTEHQKLLNKKSELTMSRYKSQRWKRDYRSSISPSVRSRKSSTERKLTTSLRMSSTERKLSTFSRRNRSNSASKTRRRSFSYRSPTSSLRSLTRGTGSDTRSTNNSRSPSSSRRGRSPRPRFDPTAWLKAKRERSKSRSNSQTWGKAPIKRRTRSASPSIRRSSSRNLSPRSEAIQRPWRSRLKTSSTANLLSQVKNSRNGLLAKRSPRRKKKLNADEQIENIDSRLSALQTFLEAAKANGEY